LTIKYLRRESFSFLPDSLVKDHDHRGSKSPPLVAGSFSIRAGRLNHRTFRRGGRFATSGRESSKRGLQPLRLPPSRLPA